MMLISPCFGLIAQAAGKLGIRLCMARGTDSAARVFSSD